MEHFLKINNRPVSNNRPVRNFSETLIIVPCGIFLKNEYLIVLGGILDRKLNFFVKTICISLKSIELTTTFSRVELYPKINNRPVLNKGFPCGIFFEIK